MFYLANGMAVDVEGAIDGMLDARSYTHYFLDSKTGDVGCSTKAAARALDGARYHKIPTICTAEKLEWMEEFAETSSVANAEKLYDMFVAHSSSRSFTDALTDLAAERGGAEWLEAWSDWEDSCAFEVLNEWIMELPIAVSYDPLAGGCGECAVCKAIENARKEGRELTEEEIEEALNQADET